jgi:hypothetical protein
MSHAQSKQFEGPDPQALIARVREELGPDARVVSGEAFRTGGILGFFARERFRMVAVAPGPSDPADDAGNGHSHDGAQPAGHEDGREDGLLAGLTGLPAMDSSGSGGGAMEDVFALLAAATQDEQHVGPASPPPAEADGLVGPIGPGTGRADTEEPLPFADVLRHVTSAPASAPATAARSGETLASPRAAAAIESSRTPVLTPMAEAALSSALAGTGLPSAQVTGVVRRVQEGQVLGSALVQVLAELPSPPPLPRVPGTIVVLVGDPARCAELAGPLAGALGADPGRIPRVAPRRVGGGTAGRDRTLRASSAEEAAGLAPGWCRGKVAVVVVDASVAGGDWPWARHVLAALAPTAVWGVVDAVAKADDIARWADQLGGLDGLVLDRVDHTGSPAAALAAGIPVAMLGDAPATAARWAAVLADLVAPWE